MDILWMLFGFVATISVLAAVLRCVEAVKENFTEGVEMLPLF